MRSSFTILFVSIYNILSTASSVTVGDNVCIEGFIMDEFCIQRGNLLDAPFQTLEHPEEHSLHCLVDVSICTGSAFNVLKGPDSSGMYSIAYQVDDDGKQLLITTARSAGAKGRCYTCSGDPETGLVKAYRAEVRGEVTDLGDGTAGNPPKLKVSSVTTSNGLSENEICASSTVNNPSPEPNSTPELPSDYPSDMPSFVFSDVPSYTPSVSTAPTILRSPTFAPIVPAPTDFCDINDCRLLFGLIPGKEVYRDIAGVCSSFCTFTFCARLLYFFGWGCGICDDAAS